MQSTGHETQAKKPGYIPLITLLKEPRPPFSIVAPEIILLHFVLLILPCDKAVSLAFLGLTAAFSSLCRQRLRRYLLHPPAAEPQHALTTPGERQIMRCNEGGELVLAMKSRNQCKNGFGSLSV